MHTLGSRAEQSSAHIEIARCKDYGDAAPLVVNMWNGQEEFEEIVHAIQSREGRTPHIIEAETSTAAESAAPASVSSTASGSNSDSENQPERALEAAGFKTPVCSHSPDPAILRAPLLPSNESQMPIPAFISGRDAPTPTPIPVPVLPPLRDIPDASLSPSPSAQ